jgi:type III pantothenate kinase
MKSPAFLLIDAGNTRVKWAVAQPGGKIRLAGDASTQSFGLPHARHLARTCPAHVVILASVVPKHTRSFQSAFGDRLTVVDAKTSGLKFAYPKPHELGADRIAAAVATQALGFAPAIIVACGTATAFTVLDSKERLAGGAIAPGLETQLAALLGATAQLPATTLKLAHRLPAKSTPDAIRAGVMLSFQGGVKETIHRLADSLPSKPRPNVILTGGNARHLSETLDLPYKLRPLLVLEGLLIIGVRLLNKLT